jgi:hypothetical protein
MHPMFVQLFLDTDADELLADEDKRRRAAVTFTIEPDELRGLAALAALNQGRDGGSGTDADAVREARALLRAALSEKLARAGLPWAPPAGAVPRQRAAADRGRGSAPARA